jgi:penicillin-binding protein 1B
VTKEEVRRAVEQFKRATERLVRHPQFKKVAIITGVVALIPSSIALYYYLKFAGIVDERLSQGLSGQSAQIYAATSDDAGSNTPPSALAATDDGFSGPEPTLITSFFDASRAKKRVIEYGEIPKTLVQAVLAGEDRIFFQHYGVNPRRIVGAFISNTRKTARTQGASTITQQLARSLFLTREPTLRRKMSEALIAMILESRLTKEQIFTMYSNEIYLGNRDTFAIHGFAEAAKAYFGKDLEELSLSEAALLAGIIPAPNAYSPVDHPDRAKTRRNLILRILLDTGQVTQTEYEEAKQAEVKISPSLDSTEGHYLVDYIREELVRDYPQGTLMSGGLRVYTTVDLKLQKVALDAVQHGLQAVEKLLAKRNKGGPPPQAGLIALDPRTGEIKAMVGGARYGDTQYNRVTRAFRQPGSIFKPFVYAAALETAAGYSQFNLDPTHPETATMITPLTTLLDEPTAFDSTDGSYTPKNYGGQYHGAVTLRTAFQRSLNIPTVMLAQAVGFGRVAAFARRLGMNPRIQGYPSVALGAFEVTPIEIAGAYTAFANEGQRVQPHALRKVISADGRVSRKYDAQPTRALSPQLAYLMTHLMEGVLTYGTGAGVRSRGFTLPAAGKTGTSRDGWFAGYTKDLLVITWVGFDDNRDLKLEGAKSALPIWAEFMKKAYELYPPRDRRSMAFSPPSGIEVAKIDMATLLRGDPSCGDSFDEAFIAGTAPTASCFESGLISHAGLGANSAP